MAGIQPRSDDKIELWPIEFGYEHFMVNNLRYHGEDVTIVWDPDGSKYGLGAGYSLFLNGEKKVSTDQLGKAHLRPEHQPGAGRGRPDGHLPRRPAGTTSRPRWTPPSHDDRVVAYLKTAGIDLTEDALNLAKGATLASSYTQQGPGRRRGGSSTRPAASTTSMNYTPGAIKETERPVSLAAVTDGVTANEPYWGNYGTTEKNGYVELDLGSAKSFDNVKVLLRQRPPGRGLPRARALVGPGARRQRRLEGGAGPVQEPDRPDGEVQRGAVRRP